MGAEQLTDLFRKYGDDVFRLAYSYLGSRADGEDVCQSVFCRLAEGRTELEPGREKAWLLTCAANACKNRFRFLRRWEGLPLEAAEAVPDESGRAVLEAVLSLPEKYRAPVHLYYYEGYSVAEIANMIGKSQGTVKSRLYRARELLRAKLEEEENREGTI